LLHPVFNQFPDIVHVAVGADADDTATDANFTADVVEDFKIPRCDLNASIEGNRQD